MHDLIVRVFRYWCWCNRASEITDVTVWNWRLIFLGQEMHTGLNYGLIDLLNFGGNPKRKCDFRGRTWAFRLSSSGLFFPHSLYLGSGCEGSEGIVSRSLEVTWWLSGGICVLMSGCFSGLSSVEEPLHLETYKGNKRRTAASKAWSFHNTAHYFPPF